MRLWLAGLILISTGCGAVSLQKIVSPGESLYYAGNDYYDGGQYDKAAEQYNQFLEKNPSSTLATPAKLNLGMSYYYLGKFDQAYKTLANLTVQDASLKDYLGKIIRESAEKTNAQPSEQPPAGSTSIAVTDASVDDTNMLTLKGNISQSGKVYVNNDPASVDDNNNFIANTVWRKGQPINILARGNDGSEGKLDYYPDSEAPEKPAGLRLASAAAENSVRLEWDKNREDDIKGYKLYYRLKNAEAQEVPDIISDLQYEVVGLANLSNPPNKTFQFYLRAVDKMNNYSNPSDILEITLP